MAFEKDVVDVIVSLAGRPITTAGFDTPIFIAQHSVFPERVRRYASADGVLADGFASGSPVHQFALNLFAGNFAPKSLVVGRRALTNHTISFPTVEDDTEYTVSIKADGVTQSFTYTSGVSATATTIAAGLDALIQAGTQATAGVITTDIITDPTVIDVALGTGTSFSVGIVTDNVKVSSTASETFADATTAISNVDGDWYFIAEDSHDNTSQLAAGSYAASVDKMFVYSTEDANALVSGDTTNIGYLLQQQQYENTTGMYSAVSDTDFPEGAIIGEWSGTNPGTSTLHGKTLQGVALDVITESQKEALKGFNLNYYVSTYGVGFFYNGETASGLFADQVRLKHWTQARVAEEVFNVIKRQSDLGSKVEMSPVGFAMIQQAIQSIIDLGIRRGAFLGDPQPTITIPTREEIPETIRAQRILPDVKFTVTSTGGVHSVEIRGFIEI